MSEKPNDGGPAFPVAPEIVSREGMSLRDYFAGQVLPSVFDSAIVNNGRTHPHWPVTISEIAEKAYAVADAMLKARGR